MIFLILLTLFALIVLAFGFLGIKLPFLNPEEDKASEAPKTVFFDQGIREKLVKDSVKETLRNTKFFKITEDQPA